MRQIAEFLDVLTAVKKGHKMRFKPTYEVVSIDFFRCLATYPAHFPYSANICCSKSTARHLHVDKAANLLRSNVAMDSSFVFLRYK